MSRRPLFQLSFLYYSLAAVLLTALVPGGGAIAADATREAAHSSSQSIASLSADSPPSGEPAMVDPAGITIDRPDTPFLLTDNKFIHRWLRPGEYMPVSDVKPGMEGFGLSVFQGTKPEKFNVRVIGVVKRVINGRDSILVRLSGPLMGKANVVRGMSGSPVYINGKIVGAVSYGFEFSTEPIAGLTPIADMLDSLAQDTQDGKGVPDRISKALSPQWTQQALDSMAAAPGMAPTRVSGGAPKMVPLMSPVALSGFSTRAQEFLADHFKDCGLYVTAGAAGALDASLDKDEGRKLKLAESTGNARELVPPGGAVCVMLSTGDFNSSACGTATTTFGGKVLAFGHPFLSAGAIDFPMATAFIHQIMPSLSVSFKVSSPIQVIGAFQSDRPWSVSGQVGHSARMIPATYTITDETRHLKRTFHCKIVNHPDLTPELLAATAMSAIDATHQSSLPYILHVRSTIDASDVGAIHRVDSFTSNFALHGMDGSHKVRMAFDPVGSYLLSTTAKILDNDYQVAEIKSVNMDISLTDGHDTARIERVFVDKPVVEPGEVVKVNCVLRPYNKEPVTKTLSLQVPRDVPDGNLLLGVSSGDDIDIVRKRMGLVDPVPDNLNQIVKKIRDAGKADSIAAVLALPEQSIMVGGATLTNPPPHWAKVFFSDRYTKGPSLVRGEVRASADQDWLVDGSHIMTVEVRRADKAAVREQALQITVPASASPQDGIFITEAAKKAMDSSRKADTTGSATSTASSTSDKATAATYFSPPKDYPHMRAVQLWHQESEEDFRAGKTINTAIDSWGRISPALQDVAQKQIGSDMRIWSAAYAGGNFYFATSNSIYKWKGDSTPPELVSKLDSTIIPSLCADSRGTLYAACVPGGKVVAVDPGVQGGNPRVVFTADEQIVACITIDNKDNLYAGVSGSGCLYKIALTGPDKKPTLLFDTGQAHVTALFFDARTERLYVGTAERGAVYSIDGQGKVKAEYQAPDHIVTGVVRDSKGNLFVSSAGKGRLVRIKPGGEVEVLGLSDAFYTVTYDTVGDCVIAGDGEGDITETSFDPLSGQPFFIPVCHTEQEAVMALSTDGKSRLFAGTSNLPFARCFELKPSIKATYISATKDAAKSAQWSRLRAYGAYNEVNDLIAKTIAVETRTGETAQPDASWSNWQEAEYAGDAYLLKSPPGRYFQYKLTWRSLLPVDTSKKESKETQTRPVAIGRIETTYLPSNSPPQFTSVSTKTGTAMSGKQEISVSGTDSDSDNLELKIETSADGGKTWQVLASNLRARKTSKETKNAKAADTAPSGGKVEENPRDDNQSGTTEQTPSSFDSVPRERSLLPTASLNITPRWLEDKPDSEKNPQESKDSKDSKEEPKVEEKAKEKSQDKEKVESKDKKATKVGKAGEKAKNKPASASQAAAVKSSEAPSTTEKISYTWDTAKAKDGSYVLRFTLDDRPSNPDDSTQNIAYRSIDVDNSPPDIRFVHATKEKDGKLKVRAQVSDKQTPIVNATYRIDDGETMALTGIGNITDGLDVTLGANDITLEHGSHKLEVQVTDKAGNTATKTVSVN